MGKQNQLQQVHRYQDMKPKIASKRLYNTWTSIAIISGNASLIIAFLGFPKRVSTPLVRSVDDVADASSFNIPLI